MVLKTTVNGKGLVNELVKQNFDPAALRGRFEVFGGICVGIWGTYGTCLLHISFSVGLII